MKACGREPMPKLTEFQRSLECDRLYTKLPTQAVSPPGREDTLRIMSWNIERGYDPQRIAEAIVALASRRRLLTGGGLEQRPDGPA